MPQVSQLTPRIGPHWPEGTSSPLLAEPGILASREWVQKSGSHSNLWKNRVSFQKSEAREHLVLRSRKAVTAVTWGWQIGLPLLAFPDQMALETYFVV